MSSKRLLSKKELEYQDSRMTFNNQAEFLLTTLGFACGFGSIWRFPYLVFKNGGGAFMIPYLVLLFVLAIPMFTLEVSIGQVSRVGLPQLLERIHPKYKGVGYIGTYICGNISTYYNLLMAYSVYFFFQSFRYPLPWDEKMETGEDWSSRYFYNDVLNISDGILNFGDIQLWLFLAYVFSQGLVYLCIRGGIQLSGKIAIYTASAPYVLLIILLIRGLFLPGAFNGLKFLLVPDVGKIFDPMVWVDAANQVIFQMSLGVSCLTLYGSYRNKGEDISSFAMGIPLLTMMCGIIGALVVFSYIGYISHVANITIQDIPLGGHELAFVIYPATLSKMPLSNLWAVLFFAVMVLLGIDSQFGFMDSLSGTIEDAHVGEFTLFGKQINGPFLRFLVCSCINLFRVLGVCLTGLLYCSQSGFYWLDLIDSYTTVLPFMGLLLFEVYFFCFQEKRFKELMSDLEANGTPIPKFVQVMLTQVDFYLLLALAIFSIYSQIKSSLSLQFSVFIIAWLIALIPFVIAFRYYKKHQSDRDDAEHEIELRDA